MLRRWRVTEGPGKGDGRFNFLVIVGIPRGMRRISSPGRDHDGVFAMKNMRQKLLHAQEDAESSNFEKAKRRRVASRGDSAYRRLAYDELVGLP